jgi:hypothetical protein
LRPGSVSSLLFLFVVFVLYLQEAVDIVQRHLHKGCHLACQELIETAAARWQDEEGDYRDDVSGCLCTDFVAFSRQWPVMCP